MLTEFSGAARPPLDFIPPDPNPLLLPVLKGLLPGWMCWRLGLTQVEVVNIERLVKLYREFQQGQTRLLIAFRHPSPDDAFCLAKLLWYLVPQASRRLAIPLQSPIHAHFIYDRGIPIWAGRGVGWLYSKLGGTPIQRGKVDRVGLRWARQLFSQGRWPLAAAPEGGNNGHSELVSPLEPGIAQMSFWCVDDLRQAERAEQVVILPLGIQYCYETPPWQAMAKLLSHLEAEVGMGPTSSPTSMEDLDPPVWLYPRLYGLGLTLLQLMEDYYQRYYGAEIAQAETSTLGDASLPDRLHRLLDAALRIAEDYFQLAPRGSLVDRCRRIEQAGWDRIYQEALRNPTKLSAVERGLADRLAEEAHLRMWHMRLVENFVAVTGHYVKENPSAERFAETLLLLRDTIVRIQGENPFPRPRLGHQIAQLAVGSPILVTERWPAYQQNRRQAVIELTQDLQTALEALIQS
ncbi:hypothetical protein XM38_006140 [Halomicronema hongdechloris C2206]|uniref:Phospholipid/glycerol acyltransferase domain-containing protein n=1 Tax=Halomicronema hongdechloris C2206 TaxID=1641165 RepID=A0A1Z3HHC5_9CYAN|nr:1-acyl-sn-glycerol-3-phosphate acyltransferase [Halomicronema hongdechloris]ASC69685.1 hypothetical protein XM38_006140 [Halomicronema hongdechloris C2206]